MENIEISIVIPAYNEENAISESIKTINSVMRGTSMQYEIIVVDDGSSDKTAERAKKEDARVIQLDENTVSYTHLPSPRD